MAAYPAELLTIGIDPTEVVRHLSWQPAPGLRFAAGVQCHAQSGSASSGSSRSTRAPRRFSRQWFEQRIKDRAERAVERRAEIETLAGKRSRTAKEREALSRLRSAERAVTRAEGSREKAARRVEARRAEQEIRKAAKGGTPIIPQYVIKAYEWILHDNGNLDEFLDLSRDEKIEVIDEAARRNRVWKEAGEPRGGRLFDYDSIHLYHSDKFFKLYASVAGKVAP